MYGYRGGEIVYLVVLKFSATSFVYKMPTKCPSCGENAVDYDQAYTQEQRVCQSCGVVVEEGSLHNEEGQSNAMNFDGTLNWKGKGNYVAGGKAVLTRVPTRNTSRGIRVLGRYVHSFSSLLRLPYEISSQIRDFLFNTVYPEKRNHPRIKYCTKVLAAGCVYVVCRQNGMKLTLRQMAEVSEVDMYSLGRFFKFILQVFNIQLEQIETEDFIPTILSQFSVEDEKCKKLASDLAELARETFIGRGKAQAGVALGIVVIAMEAVGNSPTRQKLKEVGTLYSLKHSKVLSEVQHIRQSLLKMSEQVPWISQTVGMKMIAKFAPDIIKFHQKCKKLQVSDSRPIWYETKERLNKERQMKIQRAKQRLEKERIKLLAKREKEREKVENEASCPAPENVLVVSESSLLGNLPEFSISAQNDARSDISSSDSSSYVTSLSSLSSEYILTQQTFAKQEEELDEDDKLIEYLLKKGISEDKLMDGFYESHLYSSESHSESDSDRLELDDNDIPEDDIHQYIRSPDEVAQLKRINIDIEQNAELERKLR